MKITKCYKIKTNYLTDKHPAIKEVVITNLSVMHVRNSATRVINLYKWLPLFSCKVLDFYDHHKKVDDHKLLICLLILSWSFINS